MSSNSNALGIARRCGLALAEKKADDLQILEVGDLSSITDYVVVATGTSEPHLRALRIELEKVLDGDGVRIVGIEAPSDSGWIVVDAFDVMIHLFLPEARAKYRLEHLWKDADRVALVEVKPAKKPVKKPKAAAGREKPAPKSKTKPKRR